MQNTCGRVEQIDHLEHELAVNNILHSEYIYIYIHIYIYDNKYNSLAILFIFSSVYGKEVYRY